MSTEMGNHAFQLFHNFEKRLERIETLLVQLLDEKADRETAAALTADVRKQTADLKTATPSGVPSPQP